MGLGEIIVAIGTIIEIIEKSDETN